jgi:hypothetical protein
MKTAKPEFRTTEAVSHCGIVAYARVAGQP